MKAEQAKAVIDESLEQLARELEAGESDTLKAYLKCMSVFHRYSFGNILLIYAQRPQATRVAGFHTWRKLGRHVKRGERGITIIAPVLMRKNHVEEPDESDEDPKKVLRFRAVHVFDVSQTDGEPLPEFAQVAGEPGRALDRLLELARDLEIDVSYQHLPGTAQGYSAGGSIVIQEDLGPARTFAVLAHELAHELLHQGQDSERPAITIRETEAEAVAFVVCAAAGLDTNTASSDYIQLYSGETATIAKSLDRIQKTAGRIIDAISESD